MAEAPITLLSARGVSKAYGGAALFSNVTLNVSVGDRVGLLGVNGTGKSTLLRVLAGIEKEDVGVVDRKRDAKILYLAQEPELDESRTPRELVLEGLGSWQSIKALYDEVTHAIEAGDASEKILAQQAHLSEELERLGGWDLEHLALGMLARLGVDDVDRAIGTMSGGEKRRVALAQVLVAKPDLAILDEPTNHLDADTIEWLEDYLADEYPGALLIVTHDRYVLDAVATRIVELERGTLYEYDGNYEDFLELKAERLAHEGRVEANRQNFLRREKEWLRRQPKARTTKQKARIQRAEAALAIKAPEERRAAEITGVATRVGKTILELKNVEIALGGRTLVRPLTLHMVAGERIGIVGPNGAGKTTLLKVACDELAPTGGDVVRGLQTKITYFDQSRSALEPTWSIYDNVAEREGAEKTGGGQVDLGTRQVDLRVYLEQFLFPPDKQRQAVGSLSGGERARVALAKALKNGANLLLLDEPTNDLDIATLGSLEELLAGWPGCAFVVSHDRYFLNRVATSILSFEGDGKVVKYPGNYDSYRRLKEEAKEATEAAKAEREAKVKASAPPPPPLAKSEKNGLTYAERIELGKIMDVIATAEEEVATLEATLADPKLYSERPGDVSALQSKLFAAKTEVERLVARWESLEAKASR